ncbi:prepilin peptidase [Candidatus Undinarchaeota archaeon]
MSGYLALAIAAIYLGYTSWLDIKTREVDDWITDGFIVFAVIYQVTFGFIYKNMDDAVVAVLIGIVFFVFGYLMFRFGQWGGADVKILAGLGVLLGSIKWATGFYVLDYFINVFVVAFFYSIGYSLVRSIKNEDVMKGFKKSISSDYKELVRLVGMLLAALVIIGGYMVYGMQISGRLALRLIYPLASFLVILPLFWVLIKYVKVVEDVCFRIKVNARQLVEFDLLTEDILKEGAKIARVPEKENTKERKSKASKVIYDSSDPNGMNPESIKEIIGLVEKGKLKDGFVMKWGLPFVPVFLISLLATLWLGNMLYFII